MLSALDAADPSTIVSPANTMVKTEAQSGQNGEDAKPDLSPAAANLEENGHETPVDPAISSENNEIDSDLSKFKTDPPSLPPTLSFIPMPTQASTNPP